MEIPAAIDLPRGVRALADALGAAGYDALLVGGVVRDALRGFGSSDWDLVTDAAPSAVRELAAGAPGVRSVYELGERFGTVGVALEGGARLEVTRYRTEALSVASVQQRFAIDASMRDFTINAMGLDLSDGELIDPFGGREDLQRGVLRAPGTAAARFAEDPIRVLRAARFVSELGFELEAGTAASMPEHASSLARVAAERVRDELTKLLLGEHVDRGLRVLLDSGALEVLLPEVASLDGVTQPSFHDLDVFAHTIQTVSLTPRDARLRWAALLHDVGKAATRTVEDDGRIRFFRHAQTGAEMTDAICRRMKMSSADISAIVHLVAEHMRLGDVNLENPRSVDRAVRKLDLWVGAGDGARRVVTAEEAVELTLADFGATAHRAETPRLREALGTAVSDSRERGTRVCVRSPLSGRELMDALGLPEGPSVGAAKQAIEDAIEDGALAPDDKSGALEVAREAVRSRAAEAE